MKLISENVLSYLRYYLVKPGNPPFLQEAKDCTSAIRIAIQSIEKNKENVNSFIKARGFAKQLSKNPLP